MVPVFILQIAYIVLFEDDFQFILLLGAIALNVCTFLACNPVAACLLWILWVSLLVFIPTSMLIMKVKDLTSQIKEGKKELEVARAHYEGVLASLPTGVMLFEMEKISSADNSQQAVEEKRFIDIEFVNMEILKWLDAPPGKESAESDSRSFFTNKNFREVKFVEGGTQKAQADYKFSMLSLL